MNDGSFDQVTLLKDHSYLCPAFSFFQIFLKHGVKLTHCVWLTAHQRYHQLYQYNQRAIYIYIYLRKQSPGTDRNNAAVVFSVALCPQEGQVKYFQFALSSRRKAYSHFYCRSNNMVSLKHCCVNVVIPLGLSYNLCNAQCH